MGQGAGIWPNDEGQTLAGSPQQVPKEQAHVLSHDTGAIC